MLEPGSDPIVEVDRRGTILAIVRLGVAPITARSPPSSESTILVPPIDQPLSGFGLDGYCPVTLMEKRRWKLGDKTLAVKYCGRSYLFADAAAQKAFSDAPNRYAPVLDGNDVVLAVDKNETVAGHREHGVFYQDHVYLFAREGSLHTFEGAPEKYVSAAARLAAGGRETEKK